MRIQSSEDPEGRENLAIFVPSLGATETETVIVMTPGPEVFLGVAIFLFSLILELTLARNLHVHSSLSLLRT